MKRDDGDVASPARTAGVAPLRRLLDEGVSADGAPARAGLELLRQARVARPAVGRKQRIWRQLERGEPRRRIGALRLALAAALVIACAWTASARAQWTSAIVASAYQRLFSSPGAPHATAAAGERPGHAEATSRRAAAARPSTSATRLEPTEAPAPETASRTTLANPPAGATRPAPTPATTTTARSRRAPPTAGKEQREDVAPLLAAMRAMHVDRDPARARALLGTYLAEHPRGRFSEEALAMAIQAGVALGDPAAAALADRYLALYPGGPFRETARRAKQGLPAAATPPTP